MSMGGGTPSPAPTVAGIEPDDTSSNQKATPARWFIGEDWCPLTWLVTAPLNVEYKDIRTKTGKSETVTGHDIFGDVAGLACIGLTDAVLEIESARRTVWSGTVTRPDDPAHPDYWRAKIPFSGGTYYHYWGRADQPIDDILLGPLGAASPALAHPAYRYQSYGVIKRYDFQRNNSVPSTRVKLRRVPRPALGNFPAQNSAQGESLVAGALELLTSTLFGAGLDAARFTAAQWEALSAAVIARAGCHAPSLTRDRAVREVVKDFFRYFDGWARLEAGKIVPGMFPHDGTVPGGLTEISHHDIVGTPTIGAPAFAKTVNSITLKFRDGAQKLREDIVAETARANARARKRTQPVSVDGTAIIDRTQAGQFAAEAARTGAEGDSKGSFDVRRPKIGGLNAGDNFLLDWLPYQLDQVSRITKLAETYRGPTTVTYIGERGVRPLPYRAPAGPQPSLLAAVPTPVADARVLELTSALALTPAGLYIALLAKRPPSQHPEFALTAKTVISLSLWHSPDGASYDLLGTQSGWAVRGVLRSAVAEDTAETVVQMTLDADNLDRDRLASVSAEDQADDRLLVVVGNEVMSAGSMAIDGDDWDVTCLRARQGSLAAAAASGAEVWLVYRDELSRFTHRRFIEDTDRYFKLQPFTSGAGVDLADVDPLSYHFRDRADELPVVVIDALASGLKTALPYDVTGDITDLNGDLVSFSINAVRLSSGVIVDTLTLQAGDFGPDDTAAYAFATKVVFPTAGTWRIAVRAYDARGGYTDEETGDLAVAANDAAGGYVDYRFQRSATTPATPTGDVPAGWLDAPPAGSDPLWMSKGFKAAGGALVGVWSTPVRLTGADGAAGAAGDSIFVEYSVDGATSWHEPFVDGDIYMRQKIGAGGTWSGAMRIVAETSPTSVATPTFSFSPAKYATSAVSSTVTLSCATAGAAIWYSYNGETSPYTGPFLAAQLKGITAWAEKTGMIPSDSAWDMYENNT
ncbi:chitobiase/beta-hexosaminidase C-terminal domain-containing protein [Horticoccus luteus]|uniref:Chitobiase/beta-hexosaminidase C-terminal domain-containing protein n=1 Tax=Horticoccus luteus TaxID=2862869 RepID=A0A8F9TZC8_9BACT|nr:chitobiase/beta-hexosaminidase C-terminal domain-containing protein [Horticoccus luteus]QYM80297.1 chitobiase/beta-hexosaminidase C-terminal domain-containing protein [Horticoccus luteus]